MSKTITTTIAAVQADNAGGVKADFGSKWNPVLTGTASGVSNIAVVLCFAAANKSNIAVELDGSGNIIRATFP